MKGLRQFLTFDTDAFFSGKLLIALGVKPFFQYVNGERTEKILGSKIECVIGNDNTKYSNLETTNAFEKLSIKVIDDDNFKIENMTKFKILKFEKATVYGQFQNNLSLEVLSENIEVIK